jgi:hypothetical protein
MIHRISRATNSLQHFATRFLVLGVAALGLAAAACSDNMPSEAASTPNMSLTSAQYPLVTITPTPTTLAVGATMNVQAKLSDANTSWMGQTITWKSSDPTVLSVTVTGWGTQAGTVAHLTAHKVGTASLTATSQSNTSQTKTVTVQATTSAAGSVAATCRRNVNVGTLGTLTSALSVAVPGDCILVAPGTYTLGGKLVVARSGTSSAPIIVQGSGSNTVINVNKMSMYVDGSYVQLRKLRLTNFNTIGLWLRGVTGVVLDSMEIDHTLQEAMKFAAGSNHNVIKNSRIHDTGILHPQWGEGVYIGGKNSDGTFDRATYNEVLNNHFGPNVRAEDVDVKEGADHNTIRGNYFDATGMVYVNFATVSVVAIVGNYATIDNNYFHLGNPEGVSFIKGVGTMVGNVATRNTMDLQPNRTGMSWASSYSPAAIAGFQYQSQALWSGATVRCDNVMISGRLSTKVPMCTP